MRIDTIRIDHDTESPLYLKLADALRRAIRSGEAQVGERLPSVRRLSDAAGVNPATAVAAYRILEREGWVAARAGSGVYVRDDGSGGTAGRIRSEENDNRDLRREASGDAADLADLAAGRVLVREGVLDLAAGAPSPALFPAAEFKSIVNEVLDRDGGWAFGYQESAGWAPFRGALAEYLLSAHGVAAELEDIRVVSGAQQGIDLAAKALLGPRDAAAVEEPTYRGALAVFWSRGAETLGVRLDRDGMDLGELERVLRERSVRLVYAIPRYQNPTTISWTEERMRGLLALAKKYDFYVLEDDLLSDLSYGVRREPTCIKAIDAEDRVIYVRSFSKVLMPGLRLGVLVTPRRLRDRFEAAKRATDIATDGLVQRALELYLRRGLHEDRLAFLRRHYGAVYAAATDAAERLLSPLGASFDRPDGGLHLWVRLGGVTGTSLRAAALARGAALIPEAVYGGGEGARRGEGVSDAHVRLSFASLSAEEAERGIGIVAAALAELRSAERGALSIRTLL